MRGVPRSSPPSAPWSWCLPLILGVILGPLMEVKMREALDLSDGEVSGLFDEPLAIFVYVLVVLALVLPPVIARARRPAHPTHHKQEVP